MLPYYNGKSQGAPPFDFQNMWKRAGDMVQNGWQNPFSMQPPSLDQKLAPSLDQKLAQYAPPSQYSPQPTSIPNDPYSQFRPDDSGMLYQQPGGLQDHVFYPGGNKDGLPGMSHVDDSGMLYRPGVNAPSGPQQYPPTVYVAHGSKSERPLTYNQTAGMYEGTEGWGQYERPISLSPQEAATLPTSSGLLSPGLLGWDVNPRNPNAVPYSPPPAPLGPNGFPLHYY